MPSLTPEDQGRLLGPMKTGDGDTLKCSTCNQELRRNYCRECDEFFFLCGCKDRENEHQGHRTY